MLIEPAVGYLSGMSLLQRLSRLISGDHAMRERGENDAPTDPAHGTRPTGGGSDVDTMDVNSTTGTTESETFVGRAGSDETGDVGLSGAEARAGRTADGKPVEPSDG